MERNYANLMMILLRCILVILMIYKNKFCHVKNFLYICIKLVGEPDTEINPQGSGNIKWKSKN